MPSVLRAQIVEKLRASRMRVSSGDQWLFCRGVEEVVAAVQRGWFFGAASMIVMLILVLIGYAGGAP
jgi:hypothetical protein